MSYVDMTYGRAPNEADYLTEEFTEDEARPVNGALVNSGVAADSQMNPLPTLPPAISPSSLHRHPYSVLVSPSRANPTRGGVSNRGTPLPKQSPLSRRQLFNTSTHTPTRIPSQSPKHTPISDSRHAPCYSPIAASTQSPKHTPIAASRHTPSYSPIAASNKLFCDNPTNDFTSPAAPNPSQPNTSHSRTPLIKDITSTTTDTTTTTTTTTTRAALPPSNVTYEYRSSGAAVNSISLVTSDEDEAGARDGTATPPADLSATPTRRNASYDDMFTQLTIASDSECSISYRGRGGGDSITIGYAIATAFITSL